MGLGVQVDTTKPVAVSKEENEVTTVKNIGAPTVYYKAGPAGPTVSSTLNDGNLTTGQSLKIDQTQFFIVKKPVAGEAAPGGQIEVKTAPPVGPEYLQEDVRIVKEAPKNPFNYGAVGDASTDDGKALNECFAAAKEQTVLVPPSAGFLTTEALKIPAQTTIEGTDRRSSVFIASGEISLLDVVGDGDVTIKNLFLKSSAQQKTAGAAVDLEKGFNNRFWAENIQIGSNFYTGFNIVPMAATTISNIFIKDILFEEYTGAGEKWGGTGKGGAGFVIGHAERRVYVLQFSRILGVAKKQADMPKWMKIVNTDSLFMENCGFQNGLEGIVVGEGDTSSQGTTNLGLSNVWLDGGTEGMGKGYALNQLFSGDFVNCHAQGCQPGMYVQGNVMATVTGGKYYHNYGSGIWVAAAAKGGSSFGIHGALIADNCESKGTEIKEQCGVFLEAKASGVTITGSEIGNFLNFGGGFQKYGVYVSAECKNYIVSGNRIPEKATAVEAGETKGFNLTKGLEDLGEASKSVANNLTT